MAKITGGLGCEEAKDTTLRRVNNAGKIPC